MTELLASTLFMFSILFPTKLWYAPEQPVTVNVKATAPLSLVLVDFLGRAVDTQADTKVEGEKQVDLKQLFPAAQAGTYILYAVPAGKQLPEFAGTPLVVQIRTDKRPGAQPGPLVFRVEPLRYLSMKTSDGEMTMAFYYDVAPNTVDNFLKLAEEGYFDGQVFHRIVKKFVVQGGDPLGKDPKRAGTGGPGYMIDAEFNDRQHTKGVLSMARQGDPLERQGMMPRSEAANSASSQFFICLDYANTKALDGKYTAFGKVVGGIETIDKLAAHEVGANDRPTNPPEIVKATVKTVTPGNNPYEKLFATP
jgi:cyclophilin family peptidyl-prolyl cis-trans isomerase